MAKYPRLVGGLRVVTAEWGLTSMAILRLLSHQEPSGRVWNLERGRKYKGGPFLLKLDSSPCLQDCCHALGAQVLVTGITALHPGYFGSA